MGQWRIKELTDGRGRGEGRFLKEFIHTTADTYSSIEGSGSMLPHIFEITAAPNKR